MFCDMVGSTDLSSRLDPEDLSELIRIYQSRITGTITRSDGFIAKYMGDGVLAYFGWPRAGEADAEQAVRAALAAVDVISVTRIRGEALRVRIGIATGLVVVGDRIGTGTSFEQTAIGETPNRAARLQALVQPGGIMIDAATRRQVGDLFECRALGAMPLKGLPAPVEAFEVVGERAGQSRFEALRMQQLTPLVGREEELDLLLRRWAQATRREGRTVLVSGEPGIGKSRLLAAFDERLQGETLSRLRYFCSPHHKDTPFTPIIAQLEFASGFARADDLAERLRKLRALLDLTATPPEEVALLVELLSLPGGGPPTHNLSAQRRKELTFEALIRRAERLATQRPLLLLFEDLHWCDASTLELLDLTLSRLRKVPALIVITFRPEFVPSWTGQAGVTLLTLSRLDQAEATLLARQVTLGTVLPPPLLTRIVTQADGVPLFLEELTKAVLESPAPTDTAIGVPDTIQASLMARLDRLPAAKQAAQIGSVVGREFSRDLVHALADLSADLLDEGLDQLVASGLAFRRGEPPDATYKFKHALVQDAAYDSMLRSRRSALHGRMVEALLCLSPDAPDTQAALLGHHCAEAGLIEQAIDHWLTAGWSALAGSAGPEAIAQLQKGLQLLDRLVDEATRIRKEIDLQVALAQAFVTTTGQASLEAGAALGRARQLSQQSGELRQLGMIIWGLWGFYLNRAELAQSVGAATDLLQYAGDGGGLMAEFVGRRCIAISTLFLGEYAVARAHFAQALALQAALPQDAIENRRVFPAMNSSHSLLSWALLLQGDIVQGRVERHAALAETRNSNNLHSLAVTLHQSCVFSQLLSDRHELEEKSAELIALTTEQGFAHWLATGTIFRGWCIATSGDRAMGLAEMQRGLKAKQATGARLKVPYYLGLIAALSAESAPEHALALFAEALARVEQTGERWYEAELHRLKGEALLGSSNPRYGDAEVEFQRALEISRERGERFWELRTATSLARLWSDRGRREEAHDILAPIYGWFTGGSETHALTEAHMLLSRLAPAQKNLGA
jgi:class 3 adenylate cyclase/predicted ATPase